MQKREEKEKKSREKRKKEGKPSYNPSPLGAEVAWIYHLLPAQIFAMSIFFEISSTFKQLGKSCFFKN
jgi:hypothetical protein